MSVARHDGQPWAALAVLVAGAAFLGQAAGWRQGALWLLGAGLGFALFQARFGFAGGFRRLLLEGRGAGLRSQLVLVGALALVFLPAMEHGSLLGQPVRGFVFPVGVALLVGAFLFGIGMQLGGGCGSGTLYAAGGGAPKMWLTLAAFVAGATLAAWQAEWWQSWPSLAPVSLPARVGLWPTLAGTLAVLALVWAAACFVERRRHGEVEALSGRGGQALRGPWPLLWGAAALAALSILTFMVAGRPWAITAAFPLWGSRAVEALGWDDPSFWHYWEDPTRVEAWLRPVWADRITVMDIGLMLGALLAATLAGQARARPWPRMTEAATALAGGLLLGVGAVLASGCNISAYVGGVASGSLHGWLWVPPALAGNWVGALVVRRLTLKRQIDRVALGI